jgi:NAD(P)-dependent dehydrogenase (short-subunit alcohol dehydrogenase family)
VLDRALWRIKALDQLLSRKNVLVTGAGRNIGHSIAIEMAREGANVYFTEIDKERCKNLERQLSELAVSSRGFVADITNVSDTEKVCALLSQERVKIDILVNNVGTDYDRRMRERSVINRLVASIDSGKEASRARQIWKEVYETNVFGPVYLTDLISKLMVNGGVQGSIIFVTSIHQWTVRREATYSSSKAALGMLIKELALSLAPHKIRVNGIAPGYVEEDEHGRPLSHRLVPLHRSSISPCYIGRAAVYLASDYFSKFTTGTVLKIDAGLSLYNHMVEISPLE